MKPAPYALHSHLELSDVLRLTAQNEMHKIVAGGQSLGAMLNLRLVRVDALHDLNNLPELKQISDSVDYLTIGSMVTHAQLEDIPATDKVRQILSRVASGIAYRAVRNSGTLGGSLCHADPAADWVSAIALLAAELVIESEHGQRLVPAEQFMKSAFDTDLRAGEVLTHIRIPHRSSTTHWSYRKHCRKTGEFALAIVGAISVPETNETRLVFGALDGPPVTVTSNTLHQQLATKAGIEDLLSPLVSRATDDQIALHRDLLRQIALDIGVQS